MLYYREGEVEDRGEYQSSLIRMLVNKCSLFNQISSSTHPDNPSISPRKVEHQEICANRKLDNPHAINVAKLASKR
jgi:hypothetical protein